MAEFQCNARGTLALMPDMMPYDSDGVDVTLIRWMLSLTPEERLDVMQGAARGLAEARGENADRQLSDDRRDAGQ